MRQPGDGDTGHSLASAPAWGSRTGPLQGQRPQTSRVTPGPSSPDSHSRLPLDAGRSPGTEAKASSRVLLPNPHYPTGRIGSRTPGGARNLSKAAQLQGTTARTNQAHQTPNSSPPGRRDRPRGAERGWGAARHREPRDDPRPPVSGQPSPAPGPVTQGRRGWVWEVGG